jgi:hypothetical protein
VRKREIILSERIRLAEFSLLSAVLGLDPRDYNFVSREAQASHATDIEAIRTETSLVGNRQADIVTVYLPSFKNHFPDDLVAENRVEADHHPGEFEDGNLKFWSGLDTVTYRFWIWFHILKLQMLLYAPDTDIEELYWARFGGEKPSLGREERQYLLLLRFIAPFFRGRRLLYERILPAFIKKKVVIEENVPHEVPIPGRYWNSMGRKNAALGRSFCPGTTMIENYSTFRTHVEDLDSEDVVEFRPGGVKSRLLNKLLEITVPSHLRALTAYHFKSGIALFYLGAEEKRSYLGFSTYLRQTA